MISKLKLNFIYLSTIESSYKLYEIILLTDTGLSGPSLRSSFLKSNLLWKNLWSFKTQFILNTYKRWSNFRYDLARSSPFVPDLAQRTRWALGDLRVIRDEQILGLEILHEVYLLQFLMISCSEQRLCSKISVLHNDYCWKFFKSRQYVSARFYWWKR